MKRKTDIDVSASVLNKVVWMKCGGGLGEMRPMQFLGSSSLQSRVTSIIHLSAL